MNDSMLRHNEEGSVGSWSNVLDKAALNPQPIPPGIAFYYSVSRTIVDNAWILRDIAIGLGKNRSDDEGTAGDYISRFTEQISGASIERLIRGPRPNWLRERLQPADLLAMGSEFARASETTVDPTMRSSFATAAVRLTEAATARLSRA